VATGLWPLLNMESFEAVAGPKTDDWLVIVVGTLVTLIGLVLLLAAATRQVTLPVLLLAIGGAAGLAAIDFVYAMRGIIWPIYMLDGLGEVLLIVMWGIAILRDRRPMTSGSKSLPG